MKFHVQPGGAPSGTLRVPGDKSISHRSVMLGALAEGVTEVSGFLTGEDCLCTMKAFRAMGVAIAQPEPTRLTIHGVGLHGLRAPPTALDLGNSGTSMRLMAGLMAGQRFPTTLVGDASLSRRPMKRVIAPLEQMGAHIESTEGRAPLHIHPAAALQAIHYCSPVASAQVKSCVLLAGLYAQGRTEVFEPEASRDHTERMLRAFGAEVAAREGYAALDGGQTLRGTRIEVPADISSAAFFLVAAAITPGAELLLTDVGINPTRTGIVEVLRRMGADISLENERSFGAEPVADLRVRGGRLSGIEIGRELVAASIDEFPIIFVAAACAEGETVVSGAEELRVKESDRIQAMCDGLRILGVDAEARSDGMRVRGGTMGGGTIDSQGDHRIAMSFAIAALRATAPITILDCANVNTSFPGFAQLAREVGVAIRETCDVIGETKKKRARVPASHVSRLASHTGASAPPVIAVDGPSGVGKGLVTRWLAQRLPGWQRLDSGALYRILALAAHKRHLDLHDAAAVAKLAPALDIRFEGTTEDDERILVDGEDWTHEVRKESTGALASKIAAAPEVRAVLLQRQHDFRRVPGLIADGRDMGTIVFPDAVLKIFMDASAEERAQRRLKQLSAKGIQATLAPLCEEIRARDERDRNRPIAPLKPAMGAEVVDTTGLPPEAVVARVEALLQRYQLV